MMNTDVQSQIVDLIISIVVLIIPIAWAFVGSKVVLAFNKAAALAKKDLPANVYAAVKEAAQLGIDSARTLNLAGIINKDLTSFVNHAGQAAQQYLDHHDIKADTGLITQTILAQIDNETAKLITAPVTPAVQVQAPLVPPSPGVG
jgi:uncharacterized protein (DUF1778 family)